MKEITDVGLIAALIISGFAPVERRLRGRQVIFEFENSKALEEACQGYYNHRLMVNAFDMHMTLKQVKSSIYQMTDDRK